MRRLGLVLTLLCLAAPVAAQQGRPAAGRPNVVLFIADDLSLLDTGPYGNPVVRTPNLNRLSGESLLFTQAFAASPTCSPSRSALYSGMMPFHNGAHGNHSVARKGTLSIAQYFKAIGYRVAIAGKLHVGPEEVFSFERIANTNVPDGEGPGVLHTDLNLVPVDQWLAALKSDEPFVLIVADHSPHVVWPKQPTYDPATIDVPANQIDTPEYRFARARYYTDITKMDRNLGHLMESVRDRGLQDRTLFAFTADQGAQLPFGKWGLYDAGVHTPLIIRWPGHVTPGTKTNAMVSLVDLLPTFLEAAGGKTPAGIDGRSFLPVLTGQRLTHRDTVYASHTGDGVMNRTPMRMVRTAHYKYILNVADTIYTTHMDRVKGEGYWDSWRDRSFFDPEAAVILWRYHNRPKEELYDLQSDPDETRNLAAEAPYASIMKAMRERLATWRAEQGDAETGPENLHRDPGSKGPPYIF